MNAPLVLHTERYLAHIRRTRALRQQFFDQTLFTDPVWDLLLSLYEAELKQVRLSCDPRRTLLRCSGSWNMP